MRTLTDADADRHAAEIGEQGYTIIEDAFDAVFAKEVLGALDALVDERGITPADNGFERLESPGGDPARTRSPETP